jgi:hypothetical protein
MAVEIKTNPRYPSSMAERIKNRHRNSGGEEADTIVKTGDGERRTFHNIHNPGSARQHGNPNAGDPDISGNKRGVV